MSKKVYFGLLLFILLTCKGVGAQSSKQYRALLSNNKNVLFPKTLIYDAPNLPISFQDYISLGFDYISVYSMNDPKSVPNRYKYLLWTGIASNWRKRSISTHSNGSIHSLLSQISA